MFLTAERPKRMIARSTLAIAFNVSCMALAGLLGTTTRSIATAVVRIALGMSTRGRKSLRPQVAVRVRSLGSAGVALASSPTQACRSATPNRAQYASPGSG